MISTLKICAVLLVTFAFVVAWESNSTTSISHAKSTQASDQVRQQSDTQGRANAKNGNTKDSDERVELNLGSLPNPPAPDWTDKAKPSRQESQAKTASPVKTDVKDSKSSDSRKKE